MTIQASSCQCFHFVKALSCTHTHSVCYRVNTIYWSITGCERTFITTYSTSSSRNTHCTDEGLYCPVQYCSNFAKVSQVLSVTGGSFVFLTKQAMLASPSHVMPTQVFQTSALTRDCRWMRLRLAATANPGIPRGGQRGARPPRRLRREPEERESCFL